MAAFLLYLRLSAHFFLSFPFLQKESRVLVHRRRNLLDRVFSFFSHFDLLNCCVFIMKQEILKFDSSRLLMPPFCCNVYQEQYPIKIIDATSYYTHSYKLQNRITLQREISSFFRLSWSWISQRGSIQTFIKQFFFFFLSQLDGLKKNLIFVCNFSIVLFQIQMRAFCRSRRNLKKK